MEYKKKAYSRVDMLYILQKLNDEGFTSFNINEVDEDWTWEIVASGNDKRAKELNELEAEIDNIKFVKEEVQKFSKEISNENQEFTLELEESYEISFYFHITLKDKGHLATIDYEADADSFSVNLYAGVLPEETLDELTEKYRCIEKWEWQTENKRNVGYHFDINDLKEIFNVIKQMVKLI